MSTHDNEQQRAAFEAWWETQGQYCRSGGGDYEKTFAFRAWQAAIELDRQSLGEPVAWRVRFAVSPGLDQTDYHGHNAIADYRDIDPGATSTPLYEHPAPQPADPVVKESLTVAEPVKEPSGDAVAVMAATRNIISTSRGIRAHSDIMDFVRDVIARYGNQESKNG